MMKESKRYRGYELSAVRDLTMWHVQIWPTLMNVPSLDPLEQLVSRSSLDVALGVARDRIDRRIGVRETAPKSFMRHPTIPCC
jgi:hypothetical protein